VEAAVKRGSGHRTRQAGARAKHRIGRPPKDPSGKRDQVTILLRADLKRALIKAAQEHGRTVSQEGEHWFERLLTHEATLRQLGTDLAGMEKGTVEPALWRRGYRPVRAMIDGKVWKLWAEPGFPLEGFGVVP
jgi:hypothetical protein